MTGPLVIDAEFLDRVRAFGTRTFGPDRLTRTVTEHIRSELAEITAAPTDVTEWADVVLLALAGAWRAGHDSQAIIDAIHAKQGVNEGRTWPGWAPLPELPL